MVKRGVTGLGKAEKDMYRKQLEQAFCLKLSGELAIFRYEILKKEKEAIYEAAYQIDSIISIYELLAEMSGRLSTETLEAAVMIPDILTFLYREWLKYEDSYTADIRYCLDKELAKLRRDYRDMKEENIV